jgi:hypothetical protein
MPGATVNNYDSLHEFWLEIRDNPEVPEDVIDGVLDYLDRLWCGKAGVDELDPEWEPKTGELLAPIRSNPKKS